MNDKIMNKLFDINAKLETVQTTAGHLYNIIEDAETDTHEKKRCIPCLQPEHNTSSVICHY